MHFNDWTEGVVDAGKEEEPLHRCVVNYMHGWFFGKGLQDGYNSIYRVDCIDAMWKKSYAEGYETAQSELHARTI